MTDNPLVDELQISSDDECVWRCILKNPDFDASQISTAVGLTSAEVERSLLALESAMLVRPSDRRSGFSAIDPALAVERHLARTERAIADRKLHVASARTDIPDLSRDYLRGLASSDAMPGFEVIVDVGDVRRQIAIAAESERIENRYMGPTVTSESLQVALPVDRDLLHRGVRQRSLVSAEALTDPGVYAHYEQLAALGEEVRTLPYVATQMLVIDDDLAVIPIDPKDGSLGAIFIRIRSVVATLADYFDRLWLDGDPIFTSAPKGDAPMGRHARILELMVNGTKDERIARTLNIGVRTIRRDVAELKERLGVSSRTEIVAAAVRKGWL